MNNNTQNNNMPNNNMQSYNTQNGNAYYNMQNGNAYYNMPNGNVYNNMQYNNVYMQNNNAYSNNSRKIMQSRAMFIEKYRQFFFATIAFALFSAFTLYENYSGITFPFFTMGMIAYFMVGLRLLDVKFKKDTWFYLASIELFGISTCLTADSRILFMNKVAIITLTMVFLLHEMYEDKSWTIIDYICNIFKQGIMSLENIPRLFDDGATYVKENGKSSDADNKKTKDILKYVLIGVIVSVPMLVIIIIMLASADEIFAKSIKTILDFDWIFDHLGDVIGICTLFVVVAIFGYSQLSYLNEKKASKKVRCTYSYDHIIGITVASILCIIYLMFCFIQIRYLFAGSISGKISLPEGMTYSGYARTGFFQLLFISIINVCIVLFGVYMFKNSKVLKALLTVITACTYILIASSALRMILYIQYKYLTFLRLFVLLTLLIIAFVLIGVTFCIYKKDFPLFKYIMVVVTVCYLIFSFTRPDYIIAKVNIDNMSKDTQYEFFSESPVFDDYSFIKYEIGIDGATAIIDDEAAENYKYYKGHLKERYDFKSDSEYEEYMKEKFVYYYMENIEDEFEDEKIGIRNWNLSRYLAYQLLNK